MSSSFKMYSIIYTVFVFGLCQAISYDNPKCIVDTTLEASAPDNYMDCQSDVMVQMGKTECCTIDNAKGCCEPNGNWNKMKIIGIALGVTTSILAMACIYIFWCRKNPHVAKVEAFISTRYHGMQKACSCCACCRRQVAAREKLEVMKQKAKEIPALELPAESNTDDTTFDKFWSGPMVKT